MIKILTYRVSFYSHISYPLREYQQKIIMMAYGKLRGVSARNRIVFLSIISVILFIICWIYFRDSEIDHRIFKTANYSNLKANYHASKLISTFYCNDRPVRLVVMVTSNVSSFERRAVVRGTWGKSTFSHQNDDFRTFFAVAKSYDVDTMTRLKKESETYHDIVIGDFYETFYNCSYKFEIMLEWPYKYCKFDYLLKTDDDVFINISNLFKLLKKYGVGRKGIYTGRAQYSANVLRQGKYAVSYEEYSEAKYPPFIAGGAVIFSHDVVRAVIPYFFKTPFKLEDVYVSFLVANANVAPTHQPTVRLIERFCYYDDAAIALHFKDKLWKNATLCMVELFYKMLSENVQDEFIYYHYIRPRSDYRTST